MVFDIDNNISGDFDSRLQKHVQQMEHRYVRYQNVSAHRYMECPFVIADSAVLESGTNQILQNVPANFQKMRYISKEKLEMFLKDAMKVILQNRTISSDPETDVIKLQNARMIMAGLDIWDSEHRRRIYKGHCEMEEIRNVINAENQTVDADKVLRALELRMRIVQIWGDAIVYMDKAPAGVEGVMSLNKMYPVDKMPDRIVVVPQYDGFYFKGGTRVTFDGRVVDELPKDQKKAQADAKKQRPVTMEMLIAAGVSFDPKLIEEMAILVKEQQKTACVSAKKEKVKVSEIKKESGVKINPRIAAAEERLAIVYDVLKTETGLQIPEGKKFGYEDIPGYTEANEDVQTRIRNVIAGYLHQYKYSPDRIEKSLSTRIMRVFGKETRIKRALRGGDRPRDPLKAAQAAALEQFLRKC